MKPARVSGGKAYRYCILVEPEAFTLRIKQLNRLSGESSPNGIRHGSPKLSLTSIAEDHDLHVGRWRRWRNRYRDRHKQVIPGVLGKKRAGGKAMAETAQIARATKSAERAWLLKARTGRYTRLLS
jgi:hypothetical protein